MEDDTNIDIIQNSSSPSHTIFPDMTKGSSRISHPTFNTCDPPKLSPQSKISSTIIPSFNNEPIDALPTSPTPHWLLPSINPTIPLYKSYPLVPQTNYKYDNKSFTPSEMDDDEDTDEELSDASEEEEKEYKYLLIFYNSYLDFDEDIMVADNIAGLQNGNSNDKQDQNRLV